MTNPETIPNLDETNLPISEVALEINKEDLINESPKSENRDSDKVDRLARSEIGLELNQIENSPKSKTMSESPSEKGSPSIQQLFKLAETRRLQEERVALAVLKESKERNQKEYESMLYNIKSDIENGHTLEVEIIREAIDSAQTKDEVQAILDSIPESTQIRVRSGEIKTMGALKLAKEIAPEFDNLVMYPRNEMGYERIAENIAKSKKEKADLFSDEDVEEEPASETEKAKDEADKKHEEKHDDHAHSADHGGHGHAGGHGEMPTWKKLLHRATGTFMSLFGLWTIGFKSFLDTAFGGGMKGVLKGGGSHSSGHSGGGHGGGHGKKSGGHGGGGHH